MLSALWLNYVSALRHVQRIAGCADGQAHWSKINMSVGPGTDPNNNNINNNNNNNTI